MDIALQCLFTLTTRSDDGSMFQSGIFGVSGKHLALLTKIQSLLGMRGGGGGRGGAITVFVTVTQVAGDVGRFTPVEPVINYLKYYNVKLGTEIPKLINFLSSLISNFALIHYNTLATAVQVT